MLMPKTIHPTSRTLIAYLDGELPVDERYEIQAHLNGCPACREEMDLMEADLDWFLVLEAASRTVEPSMPAGGLNRLLAATRQWTTANPGANANGNARGMEQRVNDALEVFFGPALTATSERPPEAEGVSAEKAESLLSTFLGRRAATALMTDIRRGRLERMWSPDVN